MSSKTRVAINGFGRIGRNALKIALTKKDIELVAINDLTDTTTLAHLLRHDSNYGHYHKKVTSDKSHIIVDGHKILITAEPDPLKLPWKELKVDVVIESTGRFTKGEDAAMHIKAGAKKVIISAPVKGDDKEAMTAVIGVNENEVGGGVDIISNASCTTNNITPVAAVIEEHFGIEKAMMTTIHSYTASQSLQDAPNKDLREARSAAENIVPTTTGAAIAAAQALPALKGIFAGMSVRVPTPVVSMSDFTFLLKKDTTIEEVNTVIKKACKLPRFKGIMDCTEEELVSSDYIGDPHSSIVDLKLTNVVGGNLCKVVAWYDNEWGYSNRLIEMTQLVGKTIK
ncbi:type I glyceraldehyde-3-phosphate dehydrogenase [Candidatus Saccharibacteria bacterium]|nr:type I glyceraldehyde-3-phosphate dehydrogenase [Candidatus Saccharibacteria bacterium]